jgi:hypothetical protein
MIMRTLRTLLWRWRLARLIPRLGSVTLHRDTPDYAAFLRDMRDR